jgi:hypothetical protein
MRKAMAASTLAAAVSSAVLLFGCAETSEFDQSAIGTGTATLICDGGKSFTVTYQDGYETAVVEADGQRAELTRVRTTLGLTPTPGRSFALGGSDRAFDSLEAAGPQYTPATGETGVRYSDGESLLLSRGRQATLDLGGETYSNCETPR